MVVTSVFLSNGDGIYIYIHGANFGAGALGDHIAHLFNDGVAHSGQIDPIAHHNVQINGNGVIVVEFHTDTRLMQKMRITVVSDINQKAYGIMQVNLLILIRFLILCIN